jgi:Xaa-Pro aminopeptidase
MLKPTPLGGKIQYPISDAELERRHNAVRKAMKQAGIDVFVVQNEGQDLGGYVRWLTDIPAGYPVTIVFPVDDEMTIIMSGSPNYPLPPENLARRINRRISLPYFRTLHYTNFLDADAAASRIKEMGKPTVGLVNLGRMHAGFYNHLTESLKGFEIIDFTDAVDEIRAVKSPEEIIRIRESALMHDNVFYAMPTIIRPGRSEKDIWCDVHDLACKNGSEGQIVLMIGSNPFGRPVGQGLLYFLGRRIEFGDQVFVMLESSGPGGYFCELGRIWCLGEPTKDLIDCWETAKKAQDMTAEMLKPGAKPKEILEAVNKFLIEKGYGPEDRLYAHGQGYDLIERPGMSPWETMEVKENMVFAIHPMPTSSTAQAFCCDNFLVGKDGAERLHRFPRELIVL